MFHSDRFEEAKSRILAKCITTDKGCWEWNGGRASGGYGQIKLFGVKYRTHRVMFSIFGGVLVDGLVLDHLCRNRACCNPEHLEQVTNRENARRGLFGHTVGTDTHCVNGHARSVKNIRIVNNYPKCRLCENAKVAAIMRRKAAANVAKGLTTGGKTRILPFKPRHLTV